MPPSTSVEAPPASSLMTCGAGGLVGEDASHEEIAAAVLRLGDGGTSFETAVA
jgi:hypothetical protein